MPQDQRFDIDGASVFVRSWSPAGDPLPRAPILLLHDSLGSVAQWRDFPQALANASGRTVIAYDRPGFGQSSARTERPSQRFIEEEAEQVFPPLLRALRLERLALLGHSVGGGMALCIAAQHPQAVEAVISIAAQAFVETRTLDGIRAAQAGFADPAQFARLQRWHGDKAAWVLDAWTRVWLDPARADWSLDAALGNVRCAVLAVHGDRDEFGSKAFPRRIVAGVAGPARLALLADTGHLPQRERSAEVLGLCASFLQSSAVRAVLLAAWQGVGAADDSGAAIDRLLAAWSEPHRHYHTLQHLAECLDWMAQAEVQALAVHPHEVVLALGYHDAIYDVHRHDSEQRSADLAAAALREAGVAHAVIDRVVALVLVTRHGAAAPHTADEALLVDIDLSILGAPAARFNEYDAQIRAEYAHVPVADYRFGRRSVLQAFLERPALFGTPWFRDRLEARARDHLARAIADLA